MICPSKITYFFSLLRYFFRSFNLHFSFIGKNSCVKFKNLTHGKLFNVGRNCFIDSRYSIGFEFGSNFSLRDNSIISSYSAKGYDFSGKLRIGNNVGISEFAYIQVRGDVSIGNNVIVGPRFNLISENHVFSDKNKPIKEQGVNRIGVKIEENVWIGASVTILDGVQISKNSIVAAGSVVTKSFPSNVLIGGIPAKIIKQI